MVLLTDGKKIQEGSIRYILDNDESVAKGNQNTLVGLNIFYFVVVMLYWVASMTLFKEWHVTQLYAAATVIHIPVFIFILIRYGKKTRSRLEVQSCCIGFQLYAMTFAGVMSIFPIEFDQPAVYFAPISVAFLAAFTYTYSTSMILQAVEIVAYLVASFLAKSVGVFTVDLCSCAMLWVLSIYVAKILYMHKIRENESKQTIKRTGMFDGLTGIYNRASTEFLCKEYLRKHPESSSVAVILDFDNFKAVNDNYGHPAGDVALKNFGKILKNASGTADIAGRIGGDEFFIFFKKMGIGEVEAKAEYILEKTRSLRAPDGTQPYSCSIGIAMRDMESGVNGLEGEYEAMFAKADEALYDVKNSGKNNFKILEN